MYITCLSNYDRGLFPNNDTSSFSNQLAQPIHLESGKNYEVCLAEFSYSPNHIIQREDLTFRVFDWFYQRPSDNLWGAEIKLTVQHATINNAEDLCTTMNSLINESIERFKFSKREFFTYEKNKRIWVNFEENDYITVILESSMIIVTGCARKDSKQDVLIIGKTKPADSYIYKGETREFEEKRPYASRAEKREYMSYPPDIGIADEILVYADFIRSLHVANSMASVLKFLVISRAHDSKSAKERRVLTFGSSRTYLPLINNDIYDLKFQLRSFENLPVKLESYVRILLHIREKK